MLKLLSLLALTLAFAPIALAQDKPADEAVETPAERLDRLDRELKEIRSEFTAYREGEEARDLDSRRAVRVYGDLSFRWLHLASSGARSTIAGENPKISRPEYRMRLGVTGYILDEFKHRTKYNVRLSNTGFAEYDAPLGAPAVSYRPFEAFGSTTAVQLDRFWLRHEYKRFLYLSAGRWQTPLRTTEMLFDPDVGFTGVWASLDLGRIGKLYSSGDMEDWRDFGEVEAGVSRLFLTGAAYYLAQDNVGIPQSRGHHTPQGFSLQLATKVRFGGLDNAWIFAAALHHFKGAEGIPANVGTGTTFATTSRVDAGGNVLANFTLLDLLVEAIIYEKRSASLKATAHWIYNLRGEEVSGGADEDIAAYYGGLQWGALRVEEAGEFQIRYAYVYVETNALIPEFNHEEINTNFKGHRFALTVSLATNIAFTAGATYGTRINRNEMGVGRKTDGLPGSPSGDYETRMYVGVGVRF